MKTKTSIYRRHFAFAYVLLVAVIFCGCGSSNSKQQKKQKPLNQIQHIKTNTIQMIQIDSYKYVVWNYGYAGGIVHKQNCKFWVERSKK